MPTEPCAVDACGCCCWCARSLIWHRGPEGGTFDQPPRPNDAPAKPQRPCQAQCSRALVFMRGQMKYQHISSLFSVSGNKTEWGELMGQTRLFPRGKLRETCSPREHADETGLIAAVGRHEGASQGFCSRPEICTRHNRRKTQSQMRPLTKLST